MLSTNNLTTKWIDDDLEALRTGELAIHDLLASLRADLGVQHIIYYAASVSGAPRQIAIGNTPRVWIDIYLERKYIEIDPVLRTLMKKKGPFQWSEMELDEAQKDFMREALPYMGNQGITVPIGMEPLMATLSASTTCTEEEWRSVSPDILWKLTIMGQKINALVVKEHEMTEGSQQLSQSQKQCLQLAAVGASVERISEILKISVNTVHKHMDQAQKRLQAVNQSHMIARAYLLGEITV